MPKTQDTQWRQMRFDLLAQDHAKMQAALGELLSERDPYAADLLPYQPIGGVAAYDGHERTRE